jgi:hypothetical protein
MKKYLILLSLLCIFINSSHAQFWKKVIEVVGAPVKVAVQVMTAPTETVIKAGQVAVGASNPSEVFQPYRDLAKTTGGAIGQTTPLIRLADKPQEILYAKAQDFSKKIAGKPGEFAFDLGTFTQRFYEQLAPTGTEAIAAALKNENPLVVMAAPLAAAIHSAVERLQGSSKPLPDDVKLGLKDLFPADILDKAKYTIGSIEITLPNFIGQGKKFQGDHYAVVIDNIIVFNVTPPSFKSGAWWWGHEVAHIQQYSTMGIEVFSFNYLKDLGKSIEAEANQMGDKVLNAQGSGANLYPLAEVFRTNRPSYQKQDLIVSQCIFDNDESPASYVVTKEGKIYAVSPLNGRYLHIGFAKPPLYAGTDWRFSTSKVDYSVLTNGDIVSRVPIRSPSGKIINHQSVKIGHVLKLE